MEDLEGGIGGDGLHIPDDSSHDQHDARLRQLDRLIYLVEWHLPHPSAPIADAFPHMTPEDRRGPQDHGRPRLRQARQAGTPLALRRDAAPGRRARGGALPADGPERAEAA